MRCDELLDAGPRQLHPAHAGRPLQGGGQAVGVDRAAPHQPLRLLRRHQVTPSGRDRVGHPGRCSFGDQGDARCVGTWHVRSDVTAPLDGARSPDRTATEPELSTIRHATAGGRGRTSAPAAGPVAHAPAFALALSKMATWRSWALFTSPATSVFSTSGVRNTMSRNLVSFGSSSRTPVMPVS